MRKKVLKFLQKLPEEKTEQFNKAFQLLRDTPSIPEGKIRTINAQGYSERALEFLLYDLAKAYSITDQEKYDIPVEEDEKVTPMNPAAAEGGDAGSDDGDVDPNVLKVVGAEIESDAPVKLREEFTFLNDADCPNELKILVSDKMTAYAQYIAGKEKLLSIEKGELEVTDAEKETLAAQVTAAFEENQAIYDELNHYKAEKELLGKHQLFSQLQLTREVAAMSQEQLMSFNKSSAKYFSDNNTQLEKARADKDDAKTEKIEARIEVRNQKLALVNKALGLPQK